MYITHLVYLIVGAGIVINKDIQIEQKVSKAHMPLAIAISGHTTLIGKKDNLQKWTNKLYVADPFIHSTTCHI